MLATPSLGGAMTTTVSGPVLSVGQPDTGLLGDKLGIPQPGLAVLARSRVNRLIDVAVSRRVTLVTGPPGMLVPSCKFSAARL